MNKIRNLNVARERARQRRTVGVAVDFDPSRLQLARRLAGMPRTHLARRLGVTAAAVTQFERGQARPTLPVISSMAEALEVSEGFLAAGLPLTVLPTQGAHFRSLRSTTALQRDRALAFAETAASVFRTVERYVEFPPVSLPALELPADLTNDAAASLAQQARALMGIPTGPIANVVRLLEAHGVIVVYLDLDDLTKVDAFSHLGFDRPIVLLNPEKDDKAKSRFDAAHELGHLLMHPDTEAGSRIVEQQAHSFAAEFLMPAEEIADLLPRRIDWVALHKLKQQWGTSLKALVMRGYTLGVFTHHSYQSGMKQLAIWGYPERGPLGPPENPALASLALDALGGDGFIAQLSAVATLPEPVVRRVLRAAGAWKPAITLT